ncbi:MAG TPA: hypothetical protein VHZ75_02710 [Solirubrobacteraceae bacterium]|jgi:hypothetical protein|nr:hypothetical protein [Solirubrobacteraceae bacterium]
MPVPIRVKVLVALAPLGAAAALAACGGSSDRSDTSTPATRHAAAERIIAQAIGTNPKASSAHIDGTIDLDVKGGTRFSGKTQITADGGYELRDGATVPDVDVDVDVALGSGALGGTLLVADGTGYIKLANSGYKLPDAISKTLVAPAAAAHNGLTKTGAMFYINPQNWQRNARLVGNTTVAGEPVQEITAEVRPERAFADLARLVHFLTLIRVTQAIGLPTELTPKMQAALVRSVTVAKGEVWIGTSDHVLRKAHLTGTIVVAKRDRRLLLGATSATLDATIDVSDVGDPQPIIAPTQLNPYSSLQLSLSALAEAARRQQRSAR